MRSTGIACFSISNDACPQATASSRRDRHRDAGDHPGGSALDVTHRPGRTQHRARAISGKLYESRDAAATFEPMHAVADAIETLERDWQRLSQAQELIELSQALAAGINGDDGALGRVAWGSSLQLIVYEEAMGVRDARKTMSLR